MTRRLEGSRGEPNEAEESLIETQIGQFARDFYEKVRANGGIKPFRGKPPSPERCLPEVKIIVQTYIRSFDNDPRYDRAKAAKTLKQLSGVLRDLSQNREGHQCLKVAYITHRMRTRETSRLRVDDQLLARLFDFDDSFEAFWLAVNVALEQVSKKGRKPDTAVQEFVNGLAFAWYYLAGIPPGYSRYYMKEPSPFRKCLELINRFVIPQKYKKTNDFESYGVGAVKFARAQVKKLLSQANET